MIFYLQTERAKSPKASLSILWVQLAPSPGDALGLELSRGNNTVAIRLPAK